MADITLYTNQGALGNATRQQTFEALAKVRLFKTSLAPLTPTTTKTELVAAEADYTGYPAGGIVITAFLDPILATEGGYAIQSPAIQFTTPDPTTTPNLIGGFWLESAAGDVILATQFNTPLPMQVPGQGIPVSIRQVLGN
jgi:hypothetical protein